MERIGRLTVQTNDRCDVIVLDVLVHGVESSDEELIGVDDPQFDSANAWVTGRVPEFQVVDIDGDTTMLRALFRGEKYVDAHIVRLYVEYEETEELVANELEASDDGHNDDCLEPQEIIL